MSTACANIAFKVSQSVEKAEGIHMGTLGSLLCCKHTCRGTLGSRKKKETMVLAIGLVTDQYRTFSSPVLLGVGIGSQRGKQIISLEKKKLCRKDTCIQIAIHIRRLIG